MEKPEKFSTLAEAISAAGYVEQLLGAEHQWITQRLSWLFISQSLCITAYTILSTSAGIRFEAWNNNVLRFGLPVLGIICCVTVGFAVVAATTVARELANERARLGQQINALSPARIPMMAMTTISSMRVNPRRMPKGGIGNLNHCRCFAAERRRKTGLGARASALGYQDVGILIRL